MDGDKSNIDNLLNFEDLANQNGNTYWWASDVARVLGYKTLDAFRKPIEKAMIALSASNIPISENIFDCVREIAGDKKYDKKMSRFACMLAAMNADVKKPEVAKMQNYFARWAEVIAISIENPENVERVIIRQELTEQEKSIASVAKRAGVINYPLFQNAGYRGMYNMNLKDLNRLKKVPDKEALLDYMGKNELAANLFRITQTEQKIINDKVLGQKKLEATAKDVGGKVRKAMIEISGTPPEKLAIDAKISIVRKNIKESHKQIKKIDGKNST